MREGKELPSGGTIASRIPDRNEPKDIAEAIEKAIQDWEIVKEAYIELEEDSPTYMQMYAMRGALHIVDDFLSTLKELSDFLKGGGVETIETQERETTQEPTVVPMPEKAEIGTASPSETQDTAPAPSASYSCRAGHTVDEATAKALNMVCPKCRQLLRRQENGRNI